MSANLPVSQRTHIGGSACASALGESPFKTRLMLYKEMIGEVEPEDISNKPAVYWGNRLESVIADEFALRTGKAIKVVEDTIYHPAFEYMIAHLDRGIVGELALLECKTAGASGARFWGPDGGGKGDIPHHYYLQVMHYMAVTGFERAYVAVLIGGNDFRMYLIERDENEIARIIAGESEFMEMVRTLTPPAAVVADLDF